MTKPTANTAPRNCEVSQDQQKYIIITQQITLMATAQWYPLQQHSIVITAAIPLIFAVYSISLLILILLRSDYCSRIRREPKGLSCICLVNCESDRESQINFVYMV